MPVAVSCLLPVFNGERFLAQALDSILGQTFSDFELVIVDDGSTDRSPAILADYAQRDTRISIYTKPNGGIVSALNHGLARCAGTLIARMDADDVALPDRFATQIAEFHRRPDAVAIGGLISGIDEDGTVLYSPVSFSPVTKTRFDVFPPIVANVPHPAGLFRAAAIAAIGGYRSSFPHAEDWDLYLRLAKHGNFYNPTRLVLYYREHASSITMKHMVRSETSSALAEIAALARELGLEDPEDGEEVLTVEESVRRLSGRICSARTIRRYIDLRLWRRTAARNLPEARQYRRKVLLGLINPANYTSLNDVMLNARPVLSEAKRLAKGLKALRGPDIVRPV